MSFAELLAEYGYLAILIGTFIEGELVIVLGAIAAQMGYLELWPVVGLATMGTAVGDQMAFALGRCGGRPLLDRRERWRRRAERVFSLLQRHEFLVIFGYRFLYGLRLTAAFVIGMSPIPTLRFLVISTLGIVVWASTVAGVGYLFGHAVEPFLRRLGEHHANAALVATAVVATFALVCWRRRRLEGPDS